MLSMSAVPAVAAGERPAVPRASGDQHSEAQEPQQTAAATTTDTCAELPETRISQDPTDRHVVCARSATPTERARILKSKQQQMRNNPEPAAEPSRVPVPSWCYDHVDGGWWAERERACQVRTMI
ncbi:hypothetical protein GCM10009863_66800 [Streptomyces axinellae]|uniref:Secreted protein n=1 Tax=Streptomyces axinellae TaxID=552788 RepID=A0ABP6DDM4_9ACTN